MQCYICGVESESKLGFVKKEHRLQLKDCCRTCEQYEHNTAPLKLIFSITWPWIVIITSLWLLDLDALFWLTANLLFCIPALYPITLAHELGHAAMAKLLGQDLFEIIIGQGKTFYELKVKDVFISFKPLIFMGLTFFGPKIKRFFKFRMVLIFLTGPLTNIFIAELIRRGLLDGRFVISINESFQPLAILMYSNYVLGIVNLIPFKCNSLVGKVWSDGGNILTVPFYNQSKIEELLAANYINKSYLAYERKNYKECAEVAARALKYFPDNTILKQNLATSLIELDEFDRCIEISTDIINNCNIEGDLGNYIKAAAKNNIACSIYMKDDENSLSKADELSKEALQSAPWELSIRSTRAAVLCSLGNYEESILLLNDKRFEILNKKNQASMYCVLAQAYRGKNELEKAKQYFNKAKSLFPQCVLLSRVNSFLQ